MENLIVPALLLLLSTACAQPAIPLLDKLLGNGNFEERPDPAHINNTVLLDHHALPRWTIDGPVEYVRGGPQPGGRYFAVVHGVHAVRLGNDASISQKITVKPGTLHALTFGFSRTCAQDQTLRILVPPQSSDLPLQTIYHSGGGDTYAWGFVPTTARATVVFHNPGVNEDPACGPLLDAVAIKELYPPMPGPDNLVKNGGFEEGPHLFRTSTSGVLLPPKQEDRYSPLPGWIVESLKAVRYIDAAHFSVPSGKAAVELVAGRESAIAQMLTTVPGRLYRLGFMVGDSRNSCHGDMMVVALAGGEVAKVRFRSRGAGEFRRKEVEFRAANERTRITFYSSMYHTKVGDYGSLCGPVLDDVSVRLVRSS